MKPGATAVVSVWLLLAVAVLLQAPPTDEPGLYYDEAFLAQQARDFVDPMPGVVHPPGARSTWIFGRPFPLWNAAYLGSLKSQLLIPSFTLFGASAATLRITTLCTALVGLLFFMLWAHSVFDLRTTVVASLLVAFDPSFVFFGALEWGPYTTLLLCRGAGLYGLARGWRRRRTWLLALGALSLGLGVYARADFGVVIAVFAVALVAVRGRPFLRELLARRAAVATATIAFLLGAAPMIASVVEVLRASGEISNRGGPVYRAQVLWSTLDGSHFERVIAAGGRFDEIFAFDAPASLLGLAVLASVAWLVGRRLAGSRAGRWADAAESFVLLAGLLLALAMWLIPGAVRAHHMLNLLPLPHLIVACALSPLFESPRGRIAASLGLAALLASEARVTLSTRTLIAETGGRGRFSNALDRFAAELEGDSDSRAVALDWGFHEPLLFLAPTTPSIEPIWEIPRQLQRGRPWTHRGDARHHYLVRDEPYDLFQLGPKLLALARRHEAGDPTSVEIRRYDDRQGDAAFYSVRFPKPHRLRYSGVFDVRFP